MRWSTAPKPRSHGFGWYRLQYRMAFTRALRERERFVFVDVRRMHEAPARVDVETLEQPLHGPRAERREAGVDFHGLLRATEAMRPRYGPLDFGKVAVYLTHT
jgi:hypothetical protein